MNKQLVLENSTENLPIIPFFWYREQETYEPVLFYSCVTFEKLEKVVHTINKLYKLSIEFHQDNVIVVVQNHILDENFYLSMHTYLFNKENEQLEKIPVCFNKIWQVSLSIKNLKHNTDTVLSGQVHIHDGSFSPPGCIFLKLDKEEPLFLFYLEYQDLKILYIIFNELENSSIYKNSIIETLKN